MAKVLNDAGLVEEARAALLDGLVPLSHALAAQHRLPDPGSLKGAFLPPVSTCRGESLTLLRGFTADEGQACAPVLEAAANLANAG